MVRSLTTIVLAIVWITWGVRASMRLVFIPIDYGGYLLARYTG